MLDSKLYSTASYEKHREQQDYKSQVDNTSLSTSCDRSGDVVASDAGKSLIARLRHHKQHRRKNGPSKHNETGSSKGVKMCSIFRLRVPKMDLVGRNQNGSFVPPVVSYRSPHSNSSTYTSNTASSSSWQDSEHQYSPPLPRYHPLVQQQQQQQQASWRRLFPTSQPPQRIATKTKASARAPWLPTTTSHLVPSDKRVRFAENSDGLRVRVRYVLHLNDITAQEKSKYWYSIFEEKQRQTDILTMCVHFKATKKEVIDQLLNTSYGSLAVEETQERQRHRQQQLYHAIVMNPPPDDYLRLSSCWSHVDKPDDDLCFSTLLNQPGGSYHVPVSTSCSDRLSQWTMLYASLRGLETSISAYLRTAQNRKAQLHHQQVLALSSEVKKRSQSYESRNRQKIAVASRSLSIRAYHWARCMAIADERAAQEVYQEDAHRIVLPLHPPSSCSDTLTSISSSASCSYDHKYSDLNYLPARTTRKERPSPPAEIAIDDSWGHLSLSSHYG